MDIPWEKINKTDDGCWLWTGTVGAGGKGQWQQAYFKGYSQQAHRAVYQILVGPVAAKDVLRQTCGDLLCVNPEHMAVQSRTKTHCKKGHERTPENLTKSDGCKKCMRESRIRREVEKAEEHRVFKEWMAARGR